MCLISFSTSSCSLCMWIWNWIQLWKLSFILHIKVTLKGSLKRSFLLDKWINFPDNKVGPINQFTLPPCFAKYPPVILHRAPGLDLTHLGQLPLVTQVSVSPDTSTCQGAVTCTRQLVWVIQFCNIYEESMPRARQAYAEKKLKNLNDNMSIK